MSRQPGGKELGQMFCVAGAVMYGGGLALVIGVVAGIYHLATRSSAPVEVAPVSTTAR